MEDDLVQNWILEYDKMRDLKQKTFHLRIKKISPIEEEMLQKVVDFCEWQRYQNIDAYLKTI